MLCNSFRETRSYHANSQIVTLASLYSRIKYKILLWTFKVLQGSAPSYITEMLPPNKPSRSLRSSSKRVLTFLFKEHCDYSSVRIFIFNFLLLFLILIFRYKFLTCIFINLCFIMIWCFNPQNFRSQLRDMDLREINWDMRDKLGRERN